MLSPLLFIIFLEASPHAFRTGCPWELLYADDLALTSDTLVGLLEKFHIWKTGMESKGLLVNMGKIKLMVSGPQLGALGDSGKYPCDVCRKGVASNSTYFHGCSHWVHKRCTNICGNLTYIQMQQMSRDCLPNI